MVAPAVAETPTYRLGVDEIPPPEFTPEFSAYLVETLAEWLAIVDLEGGEPGGN